MSLRSGREERRDAHQAWSDVVVPAGAPLPRELYARVREELAGKYGGLTAFSRAPAEGLWQEGSGTKRDDIVVLEVMADQIDREWCRSYRRDLERAFRQESVVVRAQELELL